MALPWTRWGLRPQTRIRLPGWIANKRVLKGIMPLAEFEAAPQPEPAISLVQPVSRAINRSYWMI